MVGGNVHRHMQQALLLISCGVWRVTAQVQLGCQDWGHIRFTHISIRPMHVTYLPYIGENLKPQAWAKWCLLHLSYYGTTLQLKQTPSASTLDKINMRTRLACQAQSDDTVVRKPSGQNHVQWICSPAASGAKSVRSLPDARGSPAFPASAASACGSLALETALLCADGSSSSACWKSWQTHGSVSSQGAEGKHRGLLRECEAASWKDQA